MAADPRLLLAGRPTDVGAAFSNALLNVGRLQNIQQQRQQQELDEQLQPLRNRLLEAQTATAEQGVLTPTQILDERNTARLNSIAQFAQQALPRLAAGDVEGTRTLLQQRRQGLVQAARQGAQVDTTEVDEAIQLLDSNPKLLAQRMQQSIDAAQQIQAGGRQPSGVKSFAPIATETGLGIPTLDPSTGQAALVPVPGAPRPPSAAVKAQELADIEVQKAERVAGVKAKQQRTSAITQELSERNRNAARSSVRLKRALTLASEAEQGLTGALKLKLGKLLPNVDVSSEAALGQALQELALDQLQNFKGPTTDFEFGVAQSIAGRLSDPRSANLARIKSLQRADFFNRREFEQFQRHTKAGGDPDAFAFNFGEPVKTKKGVFTLQDIQDTAVQNNLSIDEAIKRLNQ
jgi:hypothetical protein